MFCETEQWLYCELINETRIFLPVGIPSCFDPLPNPLHTIPFKNSGNDLIIAVEFQFLIR